MRPAVLASAVFLFLVSLAHLLRVAFHVEVLLGGVALPMWMSVAGCLFAGALASPLVRETRRR